MLVFVNGEINDLILIIVFYTFGDSYTCFTKLKCLKIYRNN